MDDLIQWVQDNWELVALVAAIFFIVKVVLPLYRRLLAFLADLAYSALFKARRSIIPSKPVVPAQVSQKVENGMAFDYRGRINRNFYFTDTHLRHKRVRFRYHLRRNTLSMSPQEREATLLFIILEAEGELNRYADRLRFSLAWGDGRCEIYHDKIRLDNRILQQNGIRSGRDLLNAEATQKNASTGGALSELLGFLQQAGRRKRATPGIKYLADRYRVPPISGQ